MPLPTQSELQALLSYDPQTGTLVWRKRPRHLFQDERSFKTWNARYANKLAFTSIDRKGYFVGAVNNVNYRAARVIYKLVQGVDANQIDHVDGNRLNNRIENLRNVTGQQNQQNMKRCSRNKSGVTGVSWNKAKNRWDAKITHNRKTTLIGRFINLDDAVAARKQEEIALGFHPNHGRG